MKKLDDMIEEALSAEDRAIWEEGRDPGYFRTAFSMFGGAQGWVVWVVMVVQAALFLVGVYCAWRGLAAEEVLGAVKWGLSGATLILMATTLKLSLMPQMQAERILRELKRLELMAARNKAP